MPQIWDGAPPAVTPDAKKAQRVIDRDNRDEAAHAIAKRVGMFSPDTVKQHPLTVAQIVKSSMPTERLQNIATHMQKAFDAAQAHALYTVRMHDPEFRDQAYADAMRESQVQSLDHYTPEGIAHLRDAQVQNIMQNQDVGSFLADMGDEESIAWLARSQSFREKYGVKTGDESITIGGTSFEPVIQGSPIVFAGAGIASNIVAGALMGGIQGLGKVTGIDALEKLGSQVMEKTQQAVRGAEEIVAVPAAGIADLAGREVDWGEQLRFWDMKHHDPLSQATATAFGYDPDDPTIARGMESLDMGFQLVGTIVIARGLSTFGDWVHRPGEAGGMFNAERAANSRWFGVPLFDRVTTLFGKYGDTATRTGALETATSNMAPGLSRLLAESFEAGGGTADLPAARAAMKQSFIDYHETAFRDTRTALTEVEAGIADAASRGVDTKALEAERMRLEAMLQAQTNYMPTYRWPHYNDVRGVMKGVEPTTRIGQFVHDMYTKPTGNSYPADSFINNLRWQEEIHLPRSIHGESPVDWAEKNAKVIGRELRAYKVPAEVIDRLIGDMTVIRSRTAFYDWAEKFANVFRTYARDSVPPEVIDRITHTIRNPEEFSVRSTVSRPTVEPDGTIGPNARRPTWTDARNRAVPTQVNEQIGGLRAPRMDDIKEASAVVREIQRKPGVRQGSAFVKAVFHNAMGFARPLIVAVKMPSITLGIQLSERLLNLIRGANTRGMSRLASRLTERGFVSIPGGIVVDMGAAGSILDRLVPGMSDIREARHVVSEMSPTDLGQILTDASSGPSRRIEVPTTEFNARFLDGTASPREVRQVFRDHAWEAEHYASDPFAKRLVRDGIEATADHLLGTQTPGVAPRPEGTEFFYHETDLANAGSIHDQGILESTTGDVPGEPGGGAYAHRLTPEEAAARIAELPPDRVLFEFAADPALATEGGTTGDLLGRRRARGEETPVHTVTFEGGVAPEQITRTFTSTPSRLSKGLGDFGESIVSRLEEKLGRPPTREEFVAELAVKGEAIDEFIGGDEVVRRAIATKSVESSGKLSVHLQEELDLLHTELGEMNKTLSDPEFYGLKPDLAAAIEARKVSILGDIEKLEARRVTRTVRTNDERGLANVLQERAQNGEWELPGRRYREEQKSIATGDDRLARNRFLSAYTKVLYGAMRWMNWDTVRSGTAADAYITWKNRLIEDGGIKPKKAAAYAEARAAYEVRDWMHDIGNKSSFQRTLANEVPFLHAWERVVYQWAIKGPTQIGGGFGAASTGIGLALEANMAVQAGALLANVFGEEVTLPDGEKKTILSMPNPLAILNFLPDVKFPDRVTIMDPGHAFIPTRLLEGELPGLAPQLTFALDYTAKNLNGPWGDFFKAMNDKLTLGGAYVPQFPGVGQITKMYEAVVGEVPPWAVGHSRKYQQYVMDRARDASIRYAYTELSQDGQTPPNPLDYTDHDLYVQARDRYWNTLNNAADEYFHGIVWTYLVGSESPASFRPTTTEEESWKQFLADNGIEGERSPEDYALIDRYLSDHPESLAFNVSMYDRASEWPTDPGFAAFREAVGNGDVRVNAPWKYKATLALAQEWDYLHVAQGRALAKAGLGNWDNMSAQEQLNHWGAYQAATGPAWTDFDEFLRSNPNANALYEKYQSKGSAVFQHTQELENQRYDLERAGVDVDARVQAIWTKYNKSVGWGTSTDAQVDWFRAHIYGDYQAQAHDIYAEIDRIKSSGMPADKADALAAEQYDKLRRLNNSLEEQNVHGITFPTPEAFGFFSKPPDVQRTYLQRWAAEPPEWLSTFQYEQLYGNLGQHGEHFLQWGDKVTAYFDESTKGMSHSSNEYEAWVKWRDTNLNAGAQRMDAVQIRNLQVAPPLSRMGAAGLLPEGDGFDYMVDQATSIVEHLNARHLSPWGSSADAQWYRGQLEGYIELMRNPDSQYYDRAVDAWWSKKAHETGIVNHNSLYRLVIWGVEGSFELPLDFSAENTLARKVSGQ